MSEKFWCIMLKGLNEIDEDGLNEMCRVDSFFKRNIPEHERRIFYIIKRYIFPQILKTTQYSSECALNEGILEQKILKDVKYNLKQCLENYKKGLSDHVKFLLIDHHKKLRELPRFHTNLRDYILKIDAADSFEGISEIIEYMSNVSLSFYVDAPTSLFAVKKKARQQKKMLLVDKATMTKMNVLINDDLKYILKITLNDLTKIIEAYQGSDANKLASKIDQSLKIFGLNMSVPNKSKVSQECLQVLQQVEDDGGLAFALDHLLDYMQDERNHSRSLYGIVRGRLEALKSELSQEQHNAPK